MLLISFLALPIRGLIAAHFINHWGVYPVQMLDGIGAGLQSVAVPGLVARILNGTGRVNVGQGAVMTVQGLGASLSPAIGGWIAQELGYSADVHDPRQLRARLDRALGRLRLRSEAGLRVAGRCATRPRRALAGAAGMSARDRAEPARLRPYRRPAPHRRQASATSPISSPSWRRSRSNAPTTLDFVVLPGDNADNGLPAQYRARRDGAEDAERAGPRHPGDHEWSRASLAAFHAALARRPLPKALTMRGLRCLFLDISGPGGGGPDFRLGDDADRLARARAATARAARARRALVFMHTYPADLKGDGETRARSTGCSPSTTSRSSTWATPITTSSPTTAGPIFAATRSTGQIEEGPVGYSVATLDGGVVSWRFKPLDDAFPVRRSITAPADHRLMREPDAGAVAGRVRRCARWCSARGAIARGRLPGRGRRLDRRWSRRRRRRSGRARIRVPAERLVDADGARPSTATGRPGQHTITRRRRALMRRRRGARRQRRRLPSAPGRRTASSARNSAPTATAGNW